MPLSSNIRGPFFAFSGVSPLFLGIACMLLIPATMIAAVPCAPQDSAITDSLTEGKMEPDAKPESVPAKQAMLIAMEDGRRIVIEFLGKQAPLAAARIRTLVEDGFYNELPFHRVESYLIQTGKRDHELPNIEGEMFEQKLRHEKGMVGMARLPNDYDSATTQFYICKKELITLNGEYTLFGKVIEGMDVVDSIKKGDKIESIVMVE